VLGSKAEAMAIAASTVIRMSDVFSAFASSVY
jgi:hypothetical protein